LLATDAATPAAAPAKIRPEHTAVTPARPPAVRVRGQLVDQNGKIVREAPAGPGAARTRSPMARPRAGPPGTRRPV
jgi:hypothetical protein